MSVIIKGMKMPKNCMECDLHFTARGLDEECIFSNDTVEDCTERRLYRCPLVEIPTPHGRLIDADEHIKSLRDGFCGERCRRNHDCFNCGIDGYIRIVENEPTVLEAEVSE